MSQYASAIDFSKYGLPPAALDGYLGDVDADLAAASAQVDSYLRGRYKVPLPGPTFPLEIVIAVCVIAAYQIVNQRGFDPHDGADSNLRTRWEDLFGRPGQRGWLQQLASGMVNLDIAADATSGVHDGAPIVSSRAGRRTGGAGCCEPDDCRGGRYNFWGNRDCW